jgi:serine O-acetyltransferase
LEEGVVVGAGAKILGAITIGAFSRVGANAVVVKSVPANLLVVGIPGQIVHRSKPQTDPDHPGLEHGQLPDLMGDSLISALARIEKLEQRLNLVENGTSEKVHLPQEGVWREKTSRFRVMSIQRPFSEEESNLYQREGSFWISVSRP